LVPLRMLSLKDKRALFDETTGKKEPRILETF
jgi:hypothetical protein